MFGFIEAVAWKSHTERRYQWDLTSYLLQALGVKDPGHFPDYVSPEDGQLDPAWIEEQLDRLLSGGVLRA